MFFSGAVGAVVAMAFGGYMWHRAQLVEIERQEEARRHAEQMDEEAKRHAEQVNDLTYVNAEKTAGEIIRQRAPGWANQGLEVVGRAAAIATPMRSTVTLRSRVAEACAGFDLRAQDRGRLTPMNSACLAFSPDGKWLAVGEHHQQMPLPYRVQVFDVARKFEVAEYAIPSEDPDIKRTGVSALAFSPGGRWLAAGLRNGRIVAWDTRRENPSRITLLGHKEQIRGLAFTPDGATLVSGSREGSLRLWTTGSAWKEILAHDVHDVLSSLVLSPDGRRVAVGCNRSGRVFELSRLRTDSSSTRPVLSLDTLCSNLAFSPDGRILIASDVDRKIAVGLGRVGGERLLIDADCGVAHTVDINHINFHPSGVLVVSGSMDNTLKVWDLAADELVFRMTALTEAAVVPVFSPDGRTLAVGTSEGTTLYDVLGLEALTARGLDDDPVLDFAFVAGATSGLPVLATASRGRRDIPSAGRGMVPSWRSRAIAPQGRVDFGDGPEEFPHVPALDAHPTRPMVAHNGGLRVCLYDADRGGLIATIPEAQATALRFSPDGQRLWGVIDDLQVVSWSVPDLRPRTKWELDQTIRVRGRIGIACLAAGSTWVVAGSRAGLVYVLRPTQGRREKVLQADGPIQSIALSPDDSLAACGQIDGRLAVYRLPSGEKVAEFPAHHDTINSVAFHPGGRILASASRDKSLALWDLRGPRPVEVIRLPSPSDRPVLAAKFSPDGRVLGMLVRNERAVRLWHLDRLRSRLADLGLDWSDGDPPSGSARGNSDSSKGASRSGPSG